ncbi:MAG: hypothetical protein ACPLYX_10195, partial [Rectinema subterraneum]|uniref:hypothetical protein n=1 Tax=Rectinema subterraneum TaxID=2653714 RepID=UPI003C7C53B6
MCQNSSIFRTCSEAGSQNQESRSHDTQDQYGQMQDMSPTARSGEPSFLCVCLNPTIQKTLV